MLGHDILNDPFLNKGTAFTLEERKEVGLLPPKVQTIEEQAEQAYAHYQRKSSIWKNAIS